MEPKNAVEWLADHVGNEDRAIAMTLMQVVDQLKRQPGFDIKAFNEGMLKHAAECEADGNKKTAFYLTVAGGEPKPDLLEGAKQQGWN